LEDDEYIFQKETEDGKIESLKIYGTPWCKIFGNWAFMRDDEKLVQIYSNIPEGLDILLTHDAPAIQGHGKITMGQWAGEDAGNKVLAKAIKEKEPKICLYGHIHSSIHTLTKMYKKDTKLRCVSLLDEKYYPLYPPYVFEMEGHID
jgi:Icc-related predicted phosphoesterase